MLRFLQNLSFIIFVGVLVVFLMLVFNLLDLRTRLYTHLFGDFLIELNIGSERVGIATSTKEIITDIIINKQIPKEKQVELFEKLGLDAEKMQVNLSEDVYKCIESVISEGEIEHSKDGSAPKILELLKVKKCFE